MAAVILGLLFMLWAPKSMPEASWNEFEVVFTGAVTGLSEGGVVGFNGIPVGNVRHIRLELSAMLTHPRCLPGRKRKLLGDSAGQHGWHCGNA